MSWKPYFVRWASFSRTMYPPSPSFETLDASLNFQVCGAFVRNMRQCGNAAPCRSITGYSMKHGVFNTSNYTTYQSCQELFIISVYNHYLPVRKNTSPFQLMGFFFDEWDYCRVSEQHTMDASPFLEFFVFMTFKHACILLHEAAFFSLHNQSSSNLNRSMETWAHLAFLQIKWGKI